MNTSETNWHDPVIEEIHAIREGLANTYHNDLAAYAAAATSHCLALGFKLSESPRHSSVSNRPNASSAPVIEQRSHA